MAREATVGAAGPVASNMKLGEDPKLVNPALSVHIEEKKRLMPSGPV